MLVFPRGRICADRFQVGYDRRRLGRLKSSSQGMAQGMALRHEGQVIDASCEGMPVWELPKSF